MKQTMRMLLVLGLLAAGFEVQAARAQEPGAPPDEPGLLDESGDDMADAGPMMAPEDHGPGMTPGRGFDRGMRRGGWGMRRGGLGPALARELDLTTEQLEKMKASREKQERKAIATRADMQLARLDLRKLMEAEKPDQRAIESQIDKIAGLRAGLEKAQAATMIEFRASLTPEQQKKLKELRVRGPQRAPRGAPGAEPRKGGDL